MRRSRSLLFGVSAALALVACGLDVVGISPASPEPTGTDVGDASFVDARRGDSGGQRPTDADAIDANEGVDAADANSCAACPPGTAHTVCGATGCLEGYRVFVTSTKSNGNLGSLTAGDTKCKDLAAAQGLGGTWKAWLASSATDARDRVTKATVPYRLLDGTLVANDFTDLTDGTVASGIDLDEKLQRVTAAVGAEVWTGANPDGSYSGLTCDGFTTENGGNTGTVGVVDQKNGAWSAVYTKTCDSNLRFYCFEQ